MPIISQIWAITGLLCIRTYIMNMWHCTNVCMSWIHVHMWHCIPAVELNWVAPTSEAPELPPWLQAGCLEACSHLHTQCALILINAHWLHSHCKWIESMRIQTGLISIHLLRWFETGLKWIGVDWRYICTWNLQSFAFVVCGLYNIIVSSVNVLNAHWMRIVAQFSFKPVWIQLDFCVVWTGLWSRRRVCDVGTKRRPTSTCLLSFLYNPRGRSRNFEILGL